MSHTLSHSAVLNASAEDLWTASRNVEAFFCHLMPELFAKNEFLEGYGEPGSIRLVTTGPGIKHTKQLKERKDKFDEETKTFGYTILEGDPRYSNFTAELHYEPLNETQSKATWTANYTPVVGESGPPEHESKAVADLVLKTMEKAVHVTRKFSHSETLDACPDVIWKACKHIDEILLDAMPQYFASATLVHGLGGPGSVRLLKFGPAIEFAREATERTDVIDMKKRKIGYTLLKGDPRFKIFSATMEFKNGPKEYTTTAVWNASYVTAGDEDVPPLEVRDVVKNVWKSLVAAAKAHPERYA